MLVFAPTFLPPLKPLDTVIFNKYLYPPEQIIHESTKLFPDYYISAMEKKDAILVYDLEE